MALEILSKPVIVLPLVFVACYFVYTYFTAKPNLPDLPWVGVTDGQWFAKTRARIWATFQYKAAIEEAYETVSCTLPLHHVHGSFLQSVSLSTPRRASRASSRASLAI
jgi:hypothetical protein